MGGRHTNIYNEKDNMITNVCKIRQYTFFSSVVAPMNTSTDVHVCNQFSSLIRHLIKKKVSQVSGRGAVWKLVKYIA